MTKLCTVLFAASLVACAADAVDNEPIATFTSRTGTTIDMFATGEHGFEVIEHGASTSPFVLVKSDVGVLSAAELYRKATGETAVPAAIAELSARVEAADATTKRSVVEQHAAEPLTTQPPAVIASSGSCPATTFQTNFCIAGAPRTWCLLNWWNGAYEYTSDTDLSFADICADIGSVVWKITNGDGGNHTITVLQGQHFSYSFHDTWGDWLHYDVVQATNDRFQFAGDMW